MQWQEQRSAEPGRYLVSPRTLSFLVCGDEVLLLRGAPRKKLWAGRLNGVGGHVEPGEDIGASAHREIEEETGLSPDDLALRAIVHISDQTAAPGVLLFVFIGHISAREGRGSREGALEWRPIANLPWEELVDDLRFLLPRLLARAEASPLIYGHYLADASGVMTFCFDPA